MDNTSQQLDQFPSLDIDEFDPKIFQGAPLMARIEGGDAFDYILQAWLQNGQQTTEPQQPFPQYQLHQQVPSMKQEGPGLFTTAAAFTRQNFGGPPRPPQLHMDSAQTLADPPFPNPQLNQRSEHPQSSMSQSGMQGFSQTLPMSAQLLDLEAAAAPRTLPMDFTSTTSAGAGFTGAGMPFRPGMQADFAQPAHSQQPTPSGASKPSHWRQGGQPIPTVFSNATQPALAPILAPGLSAPRHQEGQRPAYAASMPAGIPPLTPQQPSGEATTSVTSHNSNGHHSAPLMATTVTQASRSTGGQSHDAKHEADSQAVVDLPELPPLPIGEPTVEGARMAWVQATKRKRGPMSAASKEKERARNRRAQRRFREREKERQEERESALATLEAQLQRVQQEKESLERRNIELETSKVKKSVETVNKCMRPFWDAELYVETQAEDTLAAFPSQLQESRLLKDIDLKRMTFPEYGKVYRRFVEALQAELVEVKPGKQDHIVSLIEELCDLNLYLAYNQQDFARYICSRLDADEPSSSPAPVSVWRRCLTGLMLSKEQKKIMLATRKDLLMRLKPILMQRADLHRLVTVLGSTNTAFSNRRETNQQMLDAIDKLKKNVHQEQTLLIQTLCASHQQVLAPEQTAINIVLAYPYYPDIPMLVELIASESDSHQSANEILGLDALPPM